MNEFSRPIAPTKDDRSQPAGITTYGESKVEIPPSLRETPYTTEYFGSDVPQIEQYVREAIERAGMEDSTKSYEFVINELLDKLGLNEVHTNEVKVEKILKYFEMLSRDKDMEARKREMLKREKEAIAQKEQKQKEMMEKKYHETKEEKARYEREARDSKAKLERLEGEHKEAIYTIRQYQQKVNDLVQQQEAILKSNEYSQYQTFAQKSQMQQQVQQLRSALIQSQEREQNLIAKYNQLKSVLMQ